MAIRWKSEKSSFKDNLPIMKERFLFILAVFVLGSNSLRGQWVVKHVDREGPSIFDLEMHPLGHGLAVGSAGFVLRTDDYGETWFPIPSGIADNIDHVAFVNADTVVISTNKWEKNGTIYRSNDGGYSWEQVYTFPDFFLSLQFFNDSVGLASGLNVILRTTDGGASWIPIYDIPGMTTFKTGIIWMDIATDGIAYAGIQAWESGLNNLSRFLLKSVDSGTTWDKVVDFENVAGKCVIFFHDEWRGFIELGSSLEQTLDGGVTWKQTNNQLGVLDMAMPSDSVVFSVDWQIPPQGEPSSFAICTSMDGGMVWQCNYQVGPSLEAIHFLNDTVGFVAGWHSLILKTESGGGEIVGDFPWELYNGVSQPEGEKGLFRIHPNPARGHVQLELDAYLPHSETLQVRLVHMSGTEMYAGRIPPFAFLYSIPLEGMGSGMYMVEIRDEAGRRLGMQKLVVD